ncbi:MAG: chemotaxis protein CheB [Gammaproteobacteria bacterium]
MNDLAAVASPRQPELTPVVGIGASAGGLQALIRFFQNVKYDLGMAFVVVMHLSPSHESDAAEILQRSTSLRVVEVNDSMPIEADHVYVIAPSKHLTMVDHYLRVSERTDPNGRPVAIDLFFRALALAYREHAFGILLSGTGQDGSEGLGAIKQQGGVVIVQDPEEAEFNGMPRAAIELGVVDFVLPVAEMPFKLASIWTNARQIRLPGADDADADGGPDIAALPDQGEAGEDALADILTILRLRTRATTSATTSAPPCCAASSGACRCASAAPCRNTATCCATTAPKATTCCATC